MIYKKGDRDKNGSTDIKQIQKALFLIQDGIFGNLTFEAVRTFQKENGLVADGIVGPATWSKLMGASNGMNLASKRKITEIIIHCTATPEGNDKTVEQIRKDHIKNRGWSDIGYHFVIYRNGTIASGRSIDKIGAHCADHNAHSIGISYVGGLENKAGVAYKDLRAKDTRTPEQKSSLLKLLQDLRRIYPNARILGHRDTSPDKNGDGVINEVDWLKSCPSFDAKSEFKNL